LLICSKFVAHAGAAETSLTIALLVRYEVVEIVRLWRDP